jgi:hypothetical protein
MVKMSRKSTKRNNSILSITNNAVPEKNPAFNPDVIPQTQVSFLETFDLIDTEDLDGNILEIEDDKSIKRDHEEE